MASSSGPSPLLPSRTGRGIALAGWVLIVLYLTILSASVLPLRLLDAAWQLRVGGVLINEESRLNRTVASGSFGRLAPIARQGAISMQCASR
jgi:hypothetical protein